MQNQTVDRLNHAARVRFGAGNAGQLVLSSTVALSGVLSALFFWEYSSTVFANVWPPAALVLGLLTGLLPSEGAFFAWKRVRETKADMTTAQITASASGLWLSVATSVYSTFALFVVSFPSVPGDIARYADWLVFIALTFPLLSQIVIYAAFSISERSTIESYERARLSAIGFAAYLEAERARSMAIVEGMGAALERQLADYGAVSGAQEAERLLRDGRSDLLTIGRESLASQPEGQQARRPESQQDRQPESQPPAAYVNGAARPTR